MTPKMKLLETVSGTIHNPSENVCNEEMHFSVLRLHYCSAGSSNTDEERAWCIRSLHYKEQDVNTTRVTPYTV